MKKIGLVVKPDNRAIQKADAFEKWLTEKGFRVVRKNNQYTKDQIKNNAGPQAPRDLFCLFALGGDGTFLSALRWVGNQAVPILGIKFGEIGFLAAISEENLFMAAQAVLENRFETEARMRLQVTVLRNGRKIVNETALNDAVINKGALARLANIKTYLNDRYLTTYRADGLIVATPTGSTAYSLAAGGPIVHPAVAGIVMAPICPFTLTNRPLIVPDSVCISLQLAKYSSDIMLTVDGQAGYEINAGDVIIIKKARHATQMITFADQTYFDVLKAKLRWSGGRG